MKTGLDYFPFDVTMDERFELIEAQFGHKGFVVMVRLWMKIYGGSGYYCEWSGDAALLFSKKIGIPVQDVADIVSAAVKRGLFDRTLFQQAGTKWTTVGKTANGGSADEKPVCTPAGRPACPGPLCLRRTDCLKRDDGPPDADDGNARRAAQHVRPQPGHARCDDLRGDELCLQRRRRRRGGLRLPLRSGL
ncbi:MAG: DUF4373 domain-containing protein [Oscillospiraceae bacterium]|nr:DUF4373 domain-containing protein [Oscillospiraceae bacterium]